MKTFDIAKELYVLKQMVEDDSFEVNEETGEVTDNTALLQELAKEINIEKDVKLNGIAYMIRKIKATETSLAEEIKRLQDRKNTMVNKQTQLKNLIDFLLEGEKLKTDKFTFFYAKSTSTIIFNEEQIPSDYIEYTPRLSKKAIGDALKAGEDVPGAELKETIGLRIK